MRLSLTLSSLSGNLIPINYVYPLSTWIDSMLHDDANVEFAEWLNNHPYLLNDKQFKLFTFNQLQFDKYRLEKPDKIRLLAPRTELHISFYIKDDFEHFVKHIFHSKHFTLGNGKGRVEFLVERMKLLPKKIFKSINRFRLTMPLCLSKNMAGERYPKYLSPDAADYEQLFIQNLIDKYVATLAPHLRDAARQVLASKAITMRVQSDFRSKLLTIKSGTREEVKIRGFTYDFDLRAPEELTTFAFYAGFGEKNNMGFGFAESLE